MRLAALLLIALASGCASDRYVCFPTSTCRRAEAAWESIGEIKCYREQMKEIERRDEERSRKK